MTARTAVGVLLSGRGSNLGALLAAADAADFPARIALVVSNRADAGGLAVARAAGVPVAVVPHRDHGKDRAAHEAAVDAALRAAGCTLVCLAGWMRVLTPFLVGRWSGRMLNIHPSLLPAFPGLDTHRRALAAGVALSGCTVHLVTDGVDEGPILGQAAVPVRDGDGADDLARRVLAAEHLLYPAVLRAFLRGDADRAPPGSPPPDPADPADGTGALLALAPALRRGRP